jgi:hypothetical protein
MCFESLKFDTGNIAAIFLFSAYRLIGVIVWLVIKNSGYGYKLIASLQCV